jgi:hypothetical protein
MIRSPDPGLLFMHTFLAIALVIGFTFLMLVAVLSVLHDLIVRLPPPTGLMLGRSEAIDQALGEDRASSPLSARDARPF